VIHRLQLYCFFCLFSFKDRFEYWTRGRNSETDRDRELRPLCTTEKGASRRPSPSCSFTCGRFKTEYAIAYPRLQGKKTMKFSFFRLEERVLLLVQLPTGNRRLESTNDRSFEHQKASLRLACHQTSAWQPEILPSWPFFALEKRARSTEESKETVALKLR